MTQILVGLNFQIFKKEGPHHQAKDLKSRLANMILPLRRLSGRVIPASEKSQ